MCYFHAAVAKRTATNPLSGEINRGHEAVIRIALSRYWAERYIEGSEDVDGYNPYPLATQQQQDAFERSGLKKPQETIEADETSAIEFLRVKLAQLEQTQSLTAKDLKLPLPTALESFYNMAVDHFYEGNPSGEFPVVEKVTRPDLIPLHRAVQALHADPETSAALETLIKGKICTVYNEAPQKVNKDLIRLYESLPVPLQEFGGKLSQYGGNILLGGFSGIIGHSVHYASVLGAGLAAGTASSLNLGLSGAFLLASYGGWHQLFGGKYQGFKEQAAALTVQAGLAFAVMGSAQALIPHDHMGNERAQWFANLPDELRQNYIETVETAQYNRLSPELRTKLDEKAEAEGLHPLVYLLTCDGTDTLSIEIYAYLDNLNEQAPPRAQQSFPAVSALNINDQPQVLNP